MCYRSGERNHFAFNNKVLKKQRQHAVCYYGQKKLVAHFIKYVHFHNIQRQPLKVRVNNLIYSTATVCVQQDTAYQ